MESSLFLQIKLYNTFLDNSTKLMTVPTEINHYFLSCISQKHSLEL